MTGGQFQDDKKHEKLWLAGVWVICAVVLYNTFEDLWTIFHYDWYRASLAELPDWLVCVRYVVSITLRIVMIWAIAGVLARREEHRKVAVWLSFFNAVTVFAHHPYQSFVNASNYLGLNSEDFQQTVMWFGRQYYPGAVVRMLNVCIEELVVAGVVILVLSYPKVKRLFQ